MFEKLSKIRSHFYNAVLFPGSVVGDSVGYLMRPITIKDPDGKYAYELKKLEDSLMPVSDDEIKKMELKLVDMMRS